MQQYITPEPEIIKHILHDDGLYPNSGLFLLIYKEHYYYLKKIRLLLLKKFLKAMTGKTYGAMAFMIIIIITVLHMKY